MASERLFLALHASQAENHSAESVISWDLSKCLVLFSLGCLSMHLQAACRTRQLA